MGLSVCTVPISAIKKFITGDGTAKKADVIAGVAVKYGVITENDNEADAIALLKFVEAQKGVVVIEK
jgi:Holliday junction resolvasome RuvABC endonuclease subunit